MIEIFEYLQHFQRQVEIFKKHVNTGISSFHNTGFAECLPYDKAISQLKSTMDLFESNLSAVGIDFKNKMNIGCHIVVAETFPRNNAVEITKAMDFASKTLVPLHFDNEIELLSNMD